MITGAQAWLAPLTFGVFSGMACMVTALLRAWVRRIDALEQRSLATDVSRMSAGHAALGGVVESLDGDHDPSPLVTDAASRPFLIRLTPGVHVLVEPGKETRLRDREARLVVGQHVFARGELEGVVSTEPYAARATLRPALLSTHAFTGEFDRRMRQMTTCLRLLVGIALGSQLLYATTYIAALRGTEAAIDGQGFAALVMFGGVAVLGLMAETVVEARP